MPLEPEIAEDLIGLLDKYPEATPVQRAIVRSATAYLVQDEEDRLNLDTEFKNYDPRLRMDRTEYEFMPDRIELWEGIARPKHWATPNRMAAVARETEQFDRIVAEGFSKADAWNEWQRRKDAGLL